MLKTYALLALKKDTSKQGLELARRIRGGSVVWLWPWQKQLRLALDDRF
jgi:hypothetical protein